jgi:hypothetical protein
MIFLDVGTYKGVMRRGWVYINGPGIRACQCGHPMRDHNENGCGFDFWGKILVDGSAPRCSCRRPHGVKSTLMGNGFR